MARLTDLQREILQRFFAARHEFFLTGGAALAGFYLGHRETHDLDLFTEGEPLDDGERTLREIASGLDLEIQSVRRDRPSEEFSFGATAICAEYRDDLVRRLVAAAYPESD